MLLSTYPTEGSMNAKTLITLKFLYMAYKSLGGLFFMVFGMLL